MNYRNKVEQFFIQILDELFPVRVGDILSETGNLNTIKPLLKELLIHNIEPVSLDLEQLWNDFLLELKSIKNSLQKDIKALYDGDPAAKSENEIIIAYPGFYAIAAYRIANFLFHQNLPLIPRIITEHAHSFTGIDIHPGATIGNYFCIDHGTGVVIGETTIIGDNVKIYQGVTLGALSVSKKDCVGQRHPTIKNNVVIYAQATILGGTTIIGENSIIGGNVWITKSVEPNSKIYYQANNENANNLNKAVYK